MLTSAMAAATTAADRHVPVKSRFIGADLTVDGSLESRRHPIGSDMRPRRAIQQVGCQPPPLPILRTSAGRASRADRTRAPSVLHLCWTRGDRAPFCLPRIPRRRPRSHAALVGKPRRTHRGTRRVGHECPTRPTDRRFRRISPSSHAGHDGDRRESRPNSRKSSFRILALGLQERRARRKPGGT